MMNVSFINGQYEYGIDLSEKGAIVFQITLEEFELIRDNKAEIINCKIEKKTNEKQTKQKLEELKKIEELQKQRTEKQYKAEKIIERYTITDQINHIRRVLQTLSKDKELYEMGEYIDSILHSDLVPNTENNVG